jgi:glutathione gamma-glutamylcysteinyltransferase
VIPSIAVAHIQSALRAARVAPAVVPLSSARGRELFSDALHAGRAEAYFALAEQRVAPQDAATAPAAALAVVLNALGHDPRRVWRAPWRWNTPAVLVAGGAPAAAAASPLLDLAALARMQGARARAVPADAHAPSAALEGQRQAPAQASGGCEALREHVARTCGDTQGDEYLLVVRGRGNGSGGGGGDSGSSVAAVAGFHAASDMVLLMELADAHGPLAWVPLHELHAAMLASAGGWLALSTHSALDHAPAAQRQHGEADAGLCPAVVRSWGAAEGALPRDAARGLAQGAPRAIPEAAMRRALALPGPSVPWRCQRRGASPSGGRTAGGGLARLHKHVQAPRAFAPVATAAA